MITPSFSPTATERVLPKLALDFTTASLDARVTLTRALNTATRVNSSGYVETINANLPRFDYDPVTLACKGLLIEESRINIITYSETYTSWVANAMTLANNVTTSPSGTTTAGSLTEPVGVTQTMAFYNSFTNTAGTYTGSIYLKKNTRQYGGLQITADNRAKRYTILLDLDTGLLASTSSTGTPTGTSYTIANAGNGWWRLSVTITNTTGTSDRLYPLVSDVASPTYVGSQPSYLGDGKGIYIWGAQVELGAFPTSYVPNLTTGTTTRNADVATMTGTNFSSWYNATEGSLYVEGSHPAILAVPCEIGVGSLVNCIQLYGAADASGSAYIRRNSSTQANISVSGAFPANTNGKLIVGFKLNSFQITANAVNGQSDTSGDMPISPTTLYIGSGTGGYYWNGTLKKIMYWPQRLINAELQAFSK